ncbi:MAG TPA: hypothetical protein DIW62_17955 [Raoultella sp.]|nr:hypothetical protein [Raoultella sp.]
MGRLKIAEAQAAGRGRQHGCWRRQALQGSYLLPSPNSQTAETKVSRSDDFSCRDAGSPGPGETGPGPFTCTAGNRKTRNLW